MITKLHKGKDKIVRAVDVKTAKSVITRPIQKVHHLEIITSSNLPNMDKSRDESSLGQYRSDPNTETELTIQPHPMDHKSSDCKSGSEKDTKAQIKTSRNGRVLKPKKLYSLKFLSKY